MELVNTDICDASSRQKIYKVACQHYVTMLFHANNTLCFGRNPKRVTFIIFIIAYPITSAGKWQPSAYKFLPYKANV